MKPVCVVLLLVLCAFLEKSLCLSCIDAPCTAEQIKAECKSNPQKCSRGYALKEFNDCSCCKVCKKILCMYYI